MDNPFEILIQQNAEILQYLRELKGSQLSTPIAAAASLDDTKMSYENLAKYLDKNISTIHRYKNNGAIPYYKVGRTVFFKKSEVDAAMSSIVFKKKGATKC
jgi:excisionase family DNA binding protein